MSDPDARSFIRAARVCVPLALTSLLLTACAPPAPAPAPVDDPSAAEVAPSGPPWFVDVARESGIDFRHVSGHVEGRYRIPEIVAGGGALFDADGDGDLDIYLVQGGSFDASDGPRPGNRLYRNDGDFTFVDVTDASGTGDTGYGMGVTAGDIDNDGDNDLYVTNVGPNVLYRNNGDGTFSDITDAAGVGDDGFGASAAFVDYDRDGRLDLVVANYLNWSVANELTCYNDMSAPDYCAPINYQAPARDVLYHNNGDGTFSDVTTAAGLGRTFGNGLGVLCGDFNGDGWTDLFVANDGMDDQLWMNGVARGGTAFVDSALRAGVARDQDGKAKAGMGVTAADIDDDGDLDLLVCNLGNEADSFHRNDGAYFSDATAVAGLAALSRPFTRFGMGWHDFDNDGHLDLYQANGRVMAKSRRYAPDDAYAEPNLLLRGSPGPRFTEVRPRGGTATPACHTSRAAAFGDIDGDGGIDILVVNRDAAPYLLRNVHPARGNWISFRLIDRDGRDALNASIRFGIGDRVITRDVRVASSYLASNDPRIHVGLGDATGVRDLNVRWPDGTTEAIGAFDANRVHEIRQK